MSLFIVPEVPNIIAIKLLFRTNVTLKLESACFIKNKTQLQRILQLGGARVCKMYRASTLARRSELFNSHFAFPL